MAAGAPSSSRTRRTSSCASRSWIISGFPRGLAGSMGHRKRRPWGGGAGPAHSAPGGGGGEPLDLGAVVVGERGRAGRVQADGGDDAVVPLRGVDDPAGTREGVGDGAAAGHAPRG